MELPNLKKFHVFCAVSIILVVMFLWLSHHKPFEYSISKGKRPFLTGKGPGTLLYPATGRPNTATEVRMDNRDGSGKDTHASNMPGAKIDAGNAKNAKKSLQTVKQTNAAVKLPPNDTHASNMPVANIDGGNDRVSTFHQDTGSQYDSKKSLQTETQTNAAVRLPPKDTHASNMPGHPGANIDGGNDKVLTFHQDAGTQYDAKKSLRTETQTNAAVTLPPKGTHASNMPGAKIDAVGDKVPTFHQDTETQDDALQMDLGLRLAPKDTHTSDIPGAKIDVGNDKVPTFHQDAGTQDDAKKSLQTETQTNAAVRLLPPMDTHASNMPGANIDAGNNKVPTFHQDAETQDDALRMNLGLRLAPKDTHASNMPGANTDAGNDNVPTFPRHSTSAPTFPVSLTLPSGRMVTPEGLSLPESSSDVLITMKTAGSSGESRLSLAFLTWMQTIDPKHVSYIYHFIQPA